MNLEAPLTESEQNRLDHRRANNLLGQFVLAVSVFLTGPGFEPVSFRASNQDGHFK